MAYYMGVRGQEQASILPAVSSELWYCITVLVFSTVHERKTVMEFTAVQQFSSDFGVLKRTSDHKRYYHPQPNIRHERRPSPNKHMSRMHEFSETALLE